MVTPETTDICILTCPRKPDYIHGTIDSLLASWNALQRFRNIRLIIDSSSKEFLSEFNNHPLFKLHRLSRGEDVEQRANRSIYNRLCYGQHRCLTTDPGNRTGVVVFEDDILLRPLWPVYLYRILHRLEQDHGDDFVLSLGAAYDLIASPSTHRSGLYLKYPEPTFYGLVGTYYPQRHAAGFAQVLLEEGIHYGRDSRKPGDMLLQDYVIDRGKILYLTPGPLVNHVGVMSTGLGGGGGYPRFQTPWDELMKLMTVP